jgi:hypothetical protein
MAEDDVVVLPGGVVRVHVLRPCESTAVMALGVVSGEPVEVRCSLVEGHEGLHRVLMAWGD